jgi:phospholipid/cholesterol/gamma-HCH transport system ATP-binding protein
MTALAEEDDKSIPPIEVRGLVNGFDGRIIHQDLDLTVDRGKVLGIVGGSGTGKSVLLNSIIGLRDPDAGTIRLFGKDTNEMNEDERGEVERRWGVLFQQGALFSSLTVRENVASPLIEHTRIPPEMADRIADLKIALVGLPNVAGDLKPAELSGGMRKRVGLARALALDPDLLVLDEPTAGLDPLAARLVRDVIADLKGTGRSIVLCTHDLAEAERLADNVMILRHGQMVASGSPATLRASASRATLVRVTFAAACPSAPTIAGRVDGVERPTLERPAGGGLPDLVYTTAWPERANPAVIADLAAAGARIVEVNGAAATLEEVYATAQGGRAEAEEEG